MNTTWKLQDARGQFSKVVEKALKSGPQYITRRGVKTVIYKVSGKCQAKKNSPEVHQRLGLPQTEGNRKKEKVTGENIARHEV